MVIAFGALAKDKLRGTSGLVIDWFRFSADVDGTGGSGGSFGALGGRRAIMKTLLGAAAVSACLFCSPASASLIISDSEPAFFSFFTLPNVVYSPGGFPGAFFTITLGNNQLDAGETLQVDLSLGWSVLFQGPYPLSLLQRDSIPPANWMNNRGRIGLTCRGEPRNRGHARRLGH